MPLGPVDFKVALFKQIGHVLGLDVSTAGFVLTSNGPTVMPTFQAAGGGAPAAPLTSIQFNNAGVFGGSAAMIFDATKGNGGSILLGGIAEPDLSPYDDDSQNGFSSITEGGLIQNNLLCAFDDFHGVGHSIYRSRGTVGVPTDNQAGDVIWFLDALGFNSGLYQYFATIVASLTADPQKAILELFAFDTAGGGGNCSIQLDTRQQLIALNAVTVVIPTSLAVSADVQAATYHTGVLAGIDAAITTAGLVGKTITVSKGIITGFT